MARLIGAAGLADEVELRALVFHSFVGKVTNLTIADVTILEEPGQSNTPWDLPRLLRANDREDFTWSGFSPLLASIRAHPGAHTYGHTLEDDSLHFGRLGIVAGEKYGDNEADLIRFTVDHLERALAQDTTLRKAFREARTDALTGLYNRRLFDQLLVEKCSLARRTNRPLTLLMVDLDHFKDINDTYGHLDGDRALTSVAELIRASVRGSDITARFGGEEFVVILPETDPAAAAVLAERIRTAISNLQFFTRTGELTRLSASLGGAAFPNEATTPKELLALVDVNLYRAKAQGRNRVVFTGPTGEGGADSLQPSTLSTPPGPQSHSDILGFAQTRNFLAQPGSTFEQKAVYAKV